MGAYKKRYGPDLEKKYKKNKKTKEERGCKCINMDDM